MRTIHRHTGDEELLAAFRQTGKSEQFLLLYDRYVPLVHGVFFKYAKNVERVQEISVQLLELLPEEVKSAEIVSFREWLYRRVRRFCLEALPETTGKLSLTPEEKLPGFGSNLALDRLLVEEAKEKSLLKCIEELPEKQRITIYRFFMEHRSCREIEESTGFSRRMIWNYIQGGRRALGECLGKKGVILPDKTSEWAASLKLTDLLRLYFRNGGKGRMANRLERDALSDPFLYEALEGLQETGGDPVNSLGLLRAGYFRRNRYGCFILCGLVCAGLAALIFCLVEGKQQPVVDLRTEQPLPTPLAGDSVVSAGAGTEQTGVLRKELETERADWLVEVENTSQPGSVPVVPLEAYNRYIRDSLAYPPDALEQKLEGKIKLSFIVNKYGRPSRIRVVEWISHSCNREAIRLIDQGPAWTYTGSAEPTCLTITFRIPDSSGK